MNFEFSAKNIPIADQRTFKEMMIKAIETFGRNLSWRALFKLNPINVRNCKETYGFRSTKAAPRIAELKDFEKDLVKLLQNIKFRKRSNKFLEELNKQCRKILQQTKLIVPADKTTNNYLVTTEKYKSLVDREIHKNYRKETPQNVEKVNKEHGKTVRELELDDRVFKTVPRNAFVTLKDHKPDFQTRPSVRLINPTKPEIGRIAMQIMDNIVNELRIKTGLKQCTTTMEVINWFKELKNRNRLNFVIFDIEGFYPANNPQTGK